MDIMLTIVIVVECLLIAGLLFVNRFFLTFKMDYSDLEELPMSIQNDNFIMPNECEIRVTKFNSGNGDHEIPEIKIVNEVSKKTFFYPDKDDTEIMFGK